MKDKNKETEGLVEELLRRMGEDPNREGLLETPGRVRRSLEYLTGGYAVDSGELVNGALFEETYDEMVVVKNIEFYSLCEHHLLPFYGRCHLGYIPNGKVVGLSKIPRFVDKFARRLQLQERMTDQIASELFDILGAKGLGLVVDGYHLCMMMRGVQKQNSYTVTSSMKGNFMNNSETRAEFMAHVQSLRMGS